jgi:hypothetical protein
VRTKDNDGDNFTKNLNKEAYEKHIVKFLGITVIIVTSLIMVVLLLQLEAVLPDMNRFATIRAIISSSQEN